jgi:hypothetical protein
VEIVVTELVEVTDTSKIVVTETPVIVVPTTSCSDVAVTPSETVPVKLIVTVLYDVCVMTVVDKVPACTVCVVETVRVAKAWNVEVAVYVVIVCSAPVTKQEHALDTRLEP